MPNWDIPAMPGFGALYSTPDDMAKYLAANIDSQSLPLGPTLEMAHIARRLASNSETKIGLAWQIGYRTNPNIVWHSGGSGGYASFIGLDPTTRLGVVLLANSAINVDDIGSHLLDFTLALAGEETASIKKLIAAPEKRGFEHALEVTNELKGHDAAFRLSEADVNEEGYRLLGQQRTRRTPMQPNT